jgi:hypothetical protein
MSIVNKVVELDYTDDYVECGIMWDQAKIRQHFFCVVLLWRIFNRAVI